jgi:PilZ domain
MATGIVSKSSVERRERRAANRYGLILPVVVQSAGQQSCSARSKDVSTGGIYLVLESDENLLPETELYLTVTFPKEITGDDEVLLRAHGKAIRVDKFGQGGTGHVGVAVVFQRRDFVRSTSPCS